MKKCFYVTSPKLSLTVFKSFKISIVNQIMKQLDVLISGYNHNTIYESGIRNTFYYQKSNIVSPYHHYFENDKKFIKALKSFSINYIYSSGYQSSTNQYVSHIEGFNPRKEYKDGPAIEKSIKETIPYKEALKNYELRSDEKKYPIYTETLEEACAYIQAVKCIYEKDIFLTGDLNVDFDINLYKQFIHDIKTCNVNLIILGNDLASLQQKEDFSVLLLPILSSNSALVEQYKSGNEKAVNSLLGKFLKDNKGYDPKEIKEELIKLINL